MNPRTQFARTASDLVETDLSVALVYAEISGQFFGEVEARHPDRVINVGIREQLLVNVGAGLALTGMRPIVHTFGSFLVERAFEQVKLGFGHQDVGGVLVGSGGSFDIASAGRTHQVPGDVALMDTLPGVHIHAPSSAEEVDAVLRRSVGSDGLHYVRVVGQTNVSSHLGSGLHVVRRGGGPTVIALGPVLDAVLEATTGLDAMVLYAHTVRPFDARGLVSALTTPDVVLVEPWLAGTSAHVVADALHAVPHRLLSLGVGRTELRRYGTPGDHVAAHGLDAAGIRRSIDGFLTAAA
ncbi:MAG: transketolase family protein [Nocardioides sp.]